MAAKCVLGFFGILVLTSSLWAHEDDPKIRDRQPPYRGPGYRAALAKAANNDFPKSDVTLLSWLPFDEIGAGISSGNDCWGYVSPTAREYAIMGFSNGTAFVEITNPGDPDLIAYLAGPTSLWRDVKTYQHYAYSVSEGGGGIQVFDMSAIDDGTVTLVNSVTGDGTDDTHNVVINTDSGFLYRTGGGDNGLRIYSLADPVNPVPVASWIERYVHDAQVVSYTEGPYAGREIAFACAGFNGGFVDTGLSIVDVTDKDNITVLSHYEYPNPAYSHQGWLSPDKQYFYLNDELDERDYSLPTTTHILDVSDLANPFQAGTFSSGATAIDHNLYTNGNYIYEANYRSGLRIFDATNPLAPVEIGFFDTYPENDDDRFNGLWSVYPFFPSGTIIGSDLEKGLFVWRYEKTPFSPFDLNQDGNVNNTDFMLMVGEWSQCGDACMGDVNENGGTEIMDMASLINNAVFK